MDGTPDTSFASQPALVESAVFDKLFNDLGVTPGFYRDERKREIDFIYHSSTKHLPIEVKYREHITSSEISSLVYYLEKKGIDKGIVVSKNLLDVREKRGGKPSSSSQ